MASYVQDILRKTAVPGVVTQGTPVAGQVARFTSADTVEGGAIGLLGSALATSGTVTLSFASPVDVVHPQLTATGAVSFALGASPREGARVRFVLVPHASGVAFSSAFFPTGHPTGDFSGHNFSAGSSYSIAMQYLAGKVLVSVGPLQTPDIANLAVTPAKIANQSIGAGADIVTTAAVFAGNSITGTSPNLTWGHAFGISSVSLTGGVSGNTPDATKPALLANGAIQTAANDVTSNSTMTTAVYQAFTTNRVMVTVDFQPDVNNNAPASGNAMLRIWRSDGTGLTISNQGIGLGVGSNNFTSVLFGRVIFTGTERVRLCILLDRTGQVFHTVAHGSVLGYQEFRTTIPFVPADWTSVDLQVLLGNVSPVAGRIWTSNWHGLKIDCNIPTFASDRDTYQYMRGALAQLEVWSSPDRRRLISLGPFSAGTLAGTVVGSTVLQSIAIGSGLSLSGATLTSTGGGGQNLDPVETTSTAITISDAVASQNLVSTAAGAVTVTLGNATSDNLSGVITEGNQTITVQVASGVQYYLEGDNQSAAGRTASFEVRGAITWMVKRIDAGNRRYLILGGTNHERNLRSVVLTGYRANYDELSGAQTLTATVAPAGCTRANIGTAATWTLPSRIASGVTASESIVVHNHHASAAITFSASGVTLVGATTLTAGQSATIEWTRKTTGTERAIVRVTT